MSEPSKSNPVTPLTPDWAKAEAKLKGIITEAQKNVGKDNHNPFLWENEVIEPLRIKLADEKSRTVELYNSIMALGDKPDTRVDKTREDVARDIPAKFAGAAKK